jgi:hypothetical protein
MDIEVRSVVDSIDVTSAATGDGNETSGASAIGGGNRDVQRIRARSREPRPGR